MPGSSLEEARFVAERIRDSIESSPFESATGRKRHVTVSIGVAGYPKTADEPGLLLKAADIALFEAKSSGRNTVRMFHGSFEGQEVARLDGSVEVDKWIHPDVATKSAEFELWDQPEIEKISRHLRLSHNQIEILKALVRIVYSYHRYAEEDLQDEFKICLLYTSPSPRD